MLDGITHVIRGDDHVSNTPTQINILRALGAELPVYAHVPDVLGDDGKKLSKRHGAVSVDDFRDDGYLPAGADELPRAARLELRRQDDDHVAPTSSSSASRSSASAPSPATFDYEKLDWLNGVYLRALPPDEYAHDLLTWLREQGIDWPEERVRATVPLVQEKIEKFSQYPDFVRFLFEPVDPPDGVDPEICRAAAERLARGRAVGGRRDRGGAARARRRAAGRSRARRSRRSGSRSPARRSRRGSSRASSCSAARRARRGSARAVVGLSGLRRRERVECALESAPAFRRNWRVGRGSRVVVNRGTSRRPAREARFIIPLK